MPRRANESLFADEPAEEATQDAAAPLAERIRPRTLTEFVGQQHLVGEGRVLRRVIEGGGLLPSLILWGAPGTGKTTLAAIGAKHANARFVAISAVASGVAELRRIIDGSCPAFIAFRRTQPAPTMCGWPTNSSRSRGRIRAASGSPAGIRRLSHRRNVVAAPPNT